MILPCTSPSDAIYADMKSSGSGRGRTQQSGHSPTGSTVLASEIEHWPIWPDPSSRRKIMALLGPTGLSNEKEWPIIECIGHKGLDVFVAVVFFGESV